MWTISSQHPYSGEMSGLHQKITSGWAAIAYVTKVILRKASAKTVPGLSTELLPKHHLSVRRLWAAILPAFSFKTFL